MTYFLILFIVLASGQNLGPYSHPAYSVFPSEAACEAYFEDEVAGEIEKEMKNRFPGQDYQVFYDCLVHPPA